MKNLSTFTLLAIGLTGLLTTAAAQPAETPKTNLPAATGTPAALPSKAVAGTNTGLRLNFRGVPLEMVLTHFSEATDFIINILPGTDVKGKVDVWSNEPLTKDEAVDLLNTILHQNGFAALRNGRTLTILSRDDAKTKDIPVRSGSKPDAIPKTDEMVTQIIPIHYANAPQLTQNLQPLLPTYATLSANESGNSLVLTATQSDVRRMAEIVQALDTAISGISTIRVFPLRHADAKELATAVKELFQTPTQSNNDRRAQFFARFGGGGEGGGRDGGRGGGGTGTSEARNAATRVVAVADERANALVVSAPDEFVPNIEQLVEKLDVSVADITELRVFILKNSDPTEMADILANLFPDETQTNQNESGGFRFGRGDFDRRNRNTQTATSERTKKRGRVMAVPDQRTSALIVSAASELMPQIAEMVEQLDANPAKKQKVFVYSLENADAQNVEEILRGLFEGNSSRNTSRSGANQNNNALNNRSQQNQQGGGNGSGFGNSGFGGGGQGGNSR